MTEVTFMIQKRLGRVAQGKKQGETLRHQVEQSDGAIASVRYDSVRDMAARFGLGRVEVKRIFGISERTQFRYEKENPVLKPAVVDRLERFKRILKQAVELFEDEEEALRWLNTPKSALDNQTPLSVLATDAGAKQVEEILYRAEYGMFG